LNNDVRRNEHNKVLVLFTQEKHKAIAVIRYQDENKELNNLGLLTNHRIFEVINIK
jgi:hypothetical protein